MLHTRFTVNRRLLALAFVAVVVLASWPVFAAATAGKTPVTAAARNELTKGKAVVLGLVEGITEYLPVSSTGHLEVAERLLDIGQPDKAFTAAQNRDRKDAADTYTIVIQAGAILAVLVLFWRRILGMLQGLIGRSDEGRRLLIAIAIAFVPSAVVGVVGDKKIKDHLLKPVPVSLAWIAGALAIFWFGSRLHRAGSGSGRALGAITNRDAAIIGLAQVAALWPGTSRSLVTILAALAVGLSLAAAVEFSFLLGLLTLTAATAYDLLKHHKVLTDTYGVATPVIGLIVAFVAAVVAVRWLVAYLQRHDLKVFGWYRLAAAAATLALVIAGTI